MWDPLETLREQKGNHQEHRQRGGENHTDQVGRVHSFSTARTTSVSTANNATVTSTNTTSRIVLLPIVDRTKAEVDPNGVPDVRSRHAGLLDDSTAARSGPRSQVKPDGRAVDRGLDEKTTP